MSTAPKKTATKAPSKAAKKAVAKPAAPSKSPLESVTKSEPTAEVAEQKAPLPSISRQKSFIVDNAGILDKQSKREILSVVINEAEPGLAMESAGWTDINLDGCPKECIERIYNLVKSRLDALNRPARFAQATV